MATAPIPYILAQTGSKRPVRTLVYGASGEPLFRTIPRNAWGEPLIIMAPGDIFTVRLDLTHRLEPGEGILEVTAKGAGCMAECQYDATSVRLILSNVTGLCAGDGMGVGRRHHHNAVVFVRFSSGDTLTQRFEVRQFNRVGSEHDLAPGQFSRGIPN